MEESSKDTVSQMAFLAVVTFAIFAPGDQIWLHVLDKSFLNKRALGKTLRKVLETQSGFRKKTSLIKFSVPWWTFA